MNEMLYGNTGKRDEGLNIDMDSSLYQKLQSRTFVPKLKSMLNDGLQEGDKNFVFIGQVADKVGNFTVVGYNAKLESDSRGGDYGHYMAVPFDEKAVAVTLDEVSFLTEEGFVEFVNQKTLNNDKRFRLAPTARAVDESVKKRIVNNLMETFMRVRKRKNVTFSFDRTTVEEFSAQSVAVLMDLMTYLPYGMRKNVSFMSHVSSNQKLPDMINLAAYSADCEFKPHDCIGLDSTGLSVADGLFSAYVEKVFAMSAADRERYFEKLYNEIELPALQAGVDLKADLYLHDVLTRVLWESGDAAEAVRSIFESVEDVVKVYPAYLQVAKTRLAGNQEETYNYIRASIAATTKPDELKVVYNNVASLFAACDFDFDGGVVPAVTAQASKLLEGALTDESFIRIADGICSINKAVLDAEVAKETIRKILGTKRDLKAAFEFYQALAEKKHISGSELQICLSECVENLILEGTKSIAEAKDKLAHLQQMYKAFQDACPDANYAPVTEVYDVYAAKFSGNANAEAVRKGNEILQGIESGLQKFDTLWDLKGYIQDIAKIEVAADAELKNRTANSYRKVADKLFASLARNDYAYGDFSKFVDELKPHVETIHQNEVYDRELRSGKTEDKAAFDGTYRFMCAFSALIEGLRGAEKMPDAVLAYEKAKSKVTSQDPEIKELFKKYAPIVLQHWLEKNPKESSERLVNKAKKALKKQDVRVSDSTITAFYAALVQEGGKGRRKKKKSPLAVIITIVLVIALLGGACVGGYFAYNHFFGDKDDAIEFVGTITPEAIEHVEKYLEGFKVDEEDKPVQLVLGTIAKGNGEVYNVTVTNNFGDTTVPEALSGIFAEEHANSKGFFKAENIKDEQVYAIVLRVTSELTAETTATCEILDFFAAPADLKTYNYQDVYNDDLVTEDEDRAFCTDLMQYVGYKYNYLEEEKPEEVDANDASEGNAPNEEGNNDEAKKPEDDKGNDKGNDKSEAKKPDNKP